MRTLIIIAVIVSTGVAAATVAVDRTRDRVERVARAMTRGDPERAPELIRRFGCAGCHTIPGIPGADGVVGPSLEGLRRRVYIGGVAPNVPDALVRWIVSPQTFSPRSAMPATGIGEADARHVAAYLYAQ